MDVLDFPIARRRSTGPATAGPETVLTDSGRATLSTSCMHERISIGGFTLDLCPDTQEARWLEARGENLVEPAEALAALFGRFDLLTLLPGLDAPGAGVLVYAPDSRRARQTMRLLPAHRWIDAAPGLWITHDGERLLMSPEDPLLAENLTRDLRA